MHIKTKILLFTLIAILNNIESSELTSHTKRTNAEEQLTDLILANATRLALHQANTHEDISRFLEKLQKKLKCHLEKNLPVEVKNEHQSFLLPRSICKESITIQNMMQDTQTQLPFKLQTEAITRNGIEHLQLLLYENSLVNEDTTHINTKEDYDNLIQALRTHDFLEIKRSLCLAKVFDTAEIVKIVKFLQQDNNEYDQRLLDKLMEQQLNLNKRCYDSCKELKGLDIFDLHRDIILRNITIIDGQILSENAYGGQAIFDSRTNEYHRINTPDIYVINPTFLNRTTFYGWFKQKKKSCHFGIFSLEETDDQKYNFEKKLILDIETGWQESYKMHATKNGDNIFVFTGNEVIVLDKNYNQKKFSLNIYWNKYVEDTKPMVNPNEPIALDEKTYLIISDKKLFKISFNFEDETVHEEKVLEIDSQNIVNLYKLTEEIFILKTTDNQKQRKLITFNIKNLKYNVLKVNKSFDKWVSHFFIDCITPYEQNKILIKTTHGKTKLIEYNINSEGLPQFEKDETDFFYNPHPYEEQIVFEWYLDEERKNLFGLLAEKGKRLIKIPLNDETQSDAATSSSHAASSSNC
jgi:hypothetical protein